MSITLPPEPKAATGRDTLASRLAVGANYYFGVGSWMYLGRCVRVGEDYAEFDRAVRLLSDGRHAEFMATGKAVNACAAASGTGPERKMIAGLASIGELMEWPHSVEPTDSWPPYQSQTTPPARKG